MRREYVYQSFERFWHWAQAVLILLLALTGFEVHGSFRFLGFASAVRLHALAAWAFLVLVVFAIFWHLTTGEWRQYVPTWRNLSAQAEYYLFGIFRNAPHPTRKTVLSKLNPLQKLVYAGLKALVIPVVVLSGLLYMFYRHPQRHDIVRLSLRAHEPIAVIHTLAAFLLLTFLVAHLYLMTTGHTVTSNLKAMLTGWEELEDPHPEPGSAPAPAETSVVS
jgi:thiosulfate reductase cytochrome b subunit